jgi:hypothetical protein
MCALHLLAAQSQARQLRENRPLVEEEDDDWGRALGPAPSKRALLPCRSVTLMLSPAGEEE